MFYSQSNLTVLAKQLALTSQLRITELLSAVTSELHGEFSPEIRGCILGFIPHLYEKAIISNPTLPADVSIKLNLLFLESFKVILRLQCNAGGFSNPIKKVFFNSVFSTMFNREHVYLKPIIDDVWYTAREHRQSPNNLLALALIKYCETSNIMLNESPLVY